MKIIDCGNEDELNKKHTQLLANISIVKAFFHEDYGNNLIKGLKDERNLIRLLVCND